jgi:spore germination protein KB
MKAKISRMQLFLIIPNMLFGKAIGITAGVMSRKIGGDTWISMVFGFVMGCFIIILLTYIASKFPDKTMIDYSEELLGKWAGKFIGILLVIFFIIAYATSANIMVLHLKDYFLTETPTIVLCFAYTLLCTYGAYLGIEVVARFSLMGLIMLMFITIAMIIGTIGDFKFINLQPLMEKGFLKDLGSSVYLFTDLAYAIFSIAIIYPMINIKKNVMKLSIGAMLLSAVMIIVWPVFEIGVMGPSVMNTFVVVCMEQIRCAQFTKYLPRYELLMVVFYVFSIFIQSSILFYCGAHGIKQVLNLKKNKNINKYIILALFVILSLLTYFMGHNENSFINFLSYPWSLICALLSIGLPFLLFVVALARGKLRRQTSL